MMTDKRWANPAYVITDEGRRALREARLAEHAARCPRCGRPTENAKDGRYCVCGWRELTDQ